MYMRSSAAASPFGLVTAVDFLRAASAFMHEGLLHTVRVRSAQLHDSPVHSRPAGISLSASAMPADSRHDRHNTPSFALIHLEDSRH
jgi:hypothetical protein